MAAKFAPLEEVRTLQDELTKLEEQKAAEEAPTTEA